jgi:magnesium transporter
LAWYALDDPNDPKLDELAVQYHLHPLHIEDCRSHNERVKSEETGEYLFYILKYIVSVDHGELTLGTICLFVGQDYFISVRDAAHSECVILDRARRAPTDTPPGKLLYLILDTIVDSFFPSIDKSDEIIDMLEDRVLEEPSPRTVEQIFDQKRKLIELRRVLGNTRDACNSMLRDPTELIPSDLYPFFRDIHDHVLRLLDSVETLRDLLNNTLDVYLSSVANRTNQVMKVLTVLSTIALPGLVITSFYGMNVKGLPFQDAQYGAFYVVVAIVITTVLMLLLMRKARWL